MESDPGRVGSTIPRCQNAAEPDRLVTSAPEFRRLLQSFRRALSRAARTTQAATAVQSHGQDLWKLGATAFQRSAAPVQDDRVIFWTRLLMSHALRSWRPRFALTQSERDRLVSLLEQTSRGMDTAAFSGATGVKKVLVSGFDPFGLMENVRVNNPSGAAALLLDGRSLTNGSITAEVQSVIFPVRFADFNAGIVEGFFRPFLSGAGRVDMIMTISQGAREFEVEGFAGRRRSDDVTDDFGVRGGGTRTAPRTPPGIRANAPEFLKTELPARQMRTALGRSRPLTGETTIEEIPADGTEPRTSTGPGAGSIAVGGSGGGFLSNEIMYRTLLLRSDVGSTVPVGHLHVPIPTDELTGPQIAAKVEKLIIDTLPSL
jgi:pyrrolidone-carboxylate peptidase